MISLSKDEKLLIIHMDDIGMSYAANRAAMDLFAKGTANSASVIVPGPWARDFIRWWADNPGYDVGVHLTHTSEWDACRWRPLSPARDVPALLDPDGFMWHGFPGELTAVPPAQIALEMVAQIRQALAWGLRPTHLDSHMGIVTAQPAFFRAYLDLAKEYRLAPHIFPWAAEMEGIAAMVRESPFPVAQGVEVDPGATLAEKKEAIRRALAALRPGLNVLTIHPVVDTPEIREIIPRWEERYLEYLAFMDEETRDAVAASGARLVTWGQVYTLYANRRE